MSAQVDQAMAGSSDALIAILDRQEALVCTRVWEAWQYRTMREEDFAGVSEFPDLIAEYVKWRDAAINIRSDRLRKEIIDAEAGILDRAQASGPDWRAGYIDGLRRALAMLEH